MTLIMNNLAFSISIFALIFTMLITYFKCKIEMADKKTRDARYANMRRAFEDHRIYYRDDTNK